MQKKLFLLLILLTALFFYQTALSQSRPGAASQGSSSPRVSSMSRTPGSGLMTNEIHAPKAGMINILLSLGLHNGSVDVTAPVGATKQTFSGSDIGLEAGYGFGEKFSGYVGFTNIDRRSTFNTTPESFNKTAGLGDNIIGFKGNINNGTSWLHYDLSYVSSNKKPINAESTNGEITAGSIRPSYNAKIAIGVPGPSFTFGGKLTYSSYQEGTYNTTTSGVIITPQTHKAGSGNAWQIFIQSSSSWKYGFSYAETKVNQYDGLQSGVPGVFAASTSLLPSIYLVAPLGPAAELILSLYRPTATSSSGAQSYYLGQGQLRFSF